MPSEPPRDAGLRAGKLSLEERLAEQGATILSNASGAREHVEGCPDCTAFLASLKALDSEHELVRAEAAVAVGRLGDLGRRARHGP